MCRRITAHGVALFFHGDAICQGALRSPIVFHATRAIAVESFSHRVAMDPEGDVELPDSNQFLVTNWVPLLES